MVDFYIKIHYNIRKALRAATHMSAKEILI